MTNGNRSVSATGWQLAVIAIIVVGIAALVSLILPAGFAFRPTATADLTARLQQLLLLAVVVERAVQVYLQLSGQDGDPTREGTDATIPATLAALVLGVIIALCGARVLDTLATLPANSAVGAIWTGTDIVLTAGLLAGGSAVFHKIISVITTGADNLRANMRVNASVRRSAEEAAAAARVAAGAAQDAAARTKVIAEVAEARAKA